MTQLNKNKQWKKINANDIDNIMGDIISMDAMREDFCP